MSAWGYGAYEPPPSKRGRPAVILWYRVYAIVMTLFYGLVFSGVVSWAFMRPDAAAGFVAIGVGLVTLVYGVGVFVPYKPWGWTLGMLVIALGLVAGFFPVAIALLLYWMKPEAKAAFRRI